MINRERFQKLVGKLIYLSHTHPNIAFVVSMVSQFMHSSGQEHFNVAYRILRYLKGTLGKGLMFRKKTTFKLKSILMQIGLVAPLIGDQLQVIVPLLEEILLHGEARKKMLWLGVVLSQNLGFLHMEFVRQYGSRDYLKI